MLGQSVEINPEVKNMHAPRHATPLADMEFEDFLKKVEVEKKLEEELKEELEEELKKKLEEELEEELKKKLEERSEEESDEESEEEFEEELEEEFEEGLEEPEEELPVVRKKINCCSCNERLMCTIRRCGRATCDGCM